MNNTITTNEICTLFTWFENQFPDFDREREDNTTARWYTCLQGMTKKDLRRGCTACQVMRDESTKMTIPPNLELFSRMCRTI